jgi:hypothetical protein
LTQFLHFAAHPDDDLLFMNPDLSAAIRSGMPSTTVFLTAGQKTGAGATEGERARSRQRGIQDAYARMAGLTPAGDQSEWTGDLLTVVGHLIDRYKLDGHDVHVIFVALRDGQLAELYAGTPHLTVVTTDGLGAPQYGYNKADVISVIRGLATIYEPSEVRSLDPLPESRYTPVDHADHTASAKLVVDANLAVPVVHYRGYGIGSVPANLAPAVAADKLATFHVYTAYDPNAADLNWTDRMYYRWPRGTSWVGHNADGRQQVFTVLRGEVLTWWQVTGGGWSQPVVLGGAGGPLAPTLAVGHNADGRMELLGRRLSDHRILSVFQRTPNGGWNPTWIDLGNHNAGSATAGQMGAPAIGRHANGRMCLFVKNGGGGVSMKSQLSPGGSWGGWVDLGGTDVQDGMAVVLNPAGGLEVFAATRTKILHWYQHTPNGAFTLNPNLPSMVPASPPTAVMDANGCARVAYRRIGGEEVAVSAQAEPASGWLPAVAGPAPGGTGQLALSLYDGEVRLAGQDANGSVSMCQLDGDGTPGSWSSLGGRTDCPAMAEDAAGQLLVFSAVGGEPAYCPLTAQPDWTPLP